MDDVSYGALALALTLVAGTVTWFAYRKRGLGAGLMGAGITLLPVAAYLTGTLRMFARIGDAVGDWAGTLVINPVVWTGIALAGLAVVLFGAGRTIQARGGVVPGGGSGRSGRSGWSGWSDEEAGPAPLPASGPAAARTSRPARPAPARPAPADDDMADIEALLKNRGIT